MAPGGCSSVARSPARGIGRASPGEPAAFRHEAVWEQEGARGTAAVVLSAGGPGEGKAAPTLRLLPPVALSISLPCISQLRLAASVGTGTAKPTVNTVYRARAVN